MLIDKYGRDFVAWAGLLAIAAGLWYVSHSLALIFAGIVIFVSAELASAKE